MATARGSDDSFEKWKAGIDRANSDWDYYDATIRRVVSEYNWHLRDTPYFRHVDWRLVKAMLWTESGPHQEDWKKKPLQIGAWNDPGLKALLYGKEGAELIVPPCFVLTVGTVTTNPRQNIAAGLGYLLMRMADYGFATVIDSHSRVVEVASRSGDSFSTIARSCGSTVDTLQKLNPGIQALRPGQVLKCQRASIQKVIIGWKPFLLANVARRYNGNGQPKGDPRYAQKLEYAMAAVVNRGRS